MGSIVEVVRNSVPWRDRRISYRIFVDGEWVDRIYNGQMRRLEVSPGIHRLRLTLGTRLGSRTFTSPTVEFGVEEGNCAKFTCGPGGPSVAVLIDLFRPHHYIKLSSVDPDSALRQNSKSRNRR